MKKVILTSLLFFVIINLFGYDQLRVGDPRSSWYTMQGTIEKATLSVRPKGLYMELGLYLTFSSRGTNWTSGNDSLEVVLNFDLPDNAIVIDSWLWIGDDIIRAKIMDRWSASAIYENIVKRRRDPSILSKVSATQYELRVFPMAGNQTRKVKITYLMPAIWNKSNVSAFIPTDILNTSLFKPAKLPVLTWTDATWTDPVIVEDTSLIFTPGSDEMFGDYFKTEIPYTKYSNLSIGFNTPVQNGLYFSKYVQGNDEGIYQFALFPDEFINTAIDKKAAILIDYDASNTTITPNELLLILKNKMINNLNSKDSFNLIFSNLIIKRYSEKWVSASKTNIEAAFNTLGNPLSSYSNLAPLLGNGIDFVKSNGNDGKLILLSDADQYGDYQVANTLINDIVALMNPKIQVHISDYQSISFPYFYIGGTYYYGNEYFYSNLSRLTLGSYHRVRDGLTVSGSIDGSFKYLGGSISSFDLHTTMSSGFCHSRYTLGGINNIAYLNEPILQVGKYNGAFPFIIEISGDYNNAVFTHKIEIPEANTTNNDTIPEEIWTGQAIKNLEYGNQSYDIVSEIINYSLTERVLSKYTSFLCLEDANQICHSCLDESLLTAIKEIKVTNDSILAYPNPFADQVTIEVMCSEPNLVKELSIYDLKGSLICQFPVGSLVKGKNRFIWDGKTSGGDFVRQGVYIISYNTTRYKKTLKVLRK